jgi:two-component system phosphate regulon sensor histidine kinase PhoR
MMAALGWLCALLIAVAAAGVEIRRRRRSREDWESFERLLGAAAEGREIKIAAFHDAERFGRLQREVTRQTSAREALRGEAVNLQTILQSMHEAVTVVDSQRVIRYVNPAFRTLFCAGLEPIGETVLGVLRESAFDEIVASVLKTGESEEREITRVVGREQHHFAVSAVPLHEAHEESGVVIIFRDISRLRQLEDVRKEFVANVSHELRTPLSIFQGYLETLLENPDLPAAEAHPMLEVMHKHSRRLNALVEDLLILARLEARDEPFKLAPIEIGRFIQGTVADWSLRSAEKRISLSADVAPGLPEIPADSFRLEQVLSNLIDNAIKYTEPGGLVKVRALPQDGGVEIRVEDTGIGIPPADLPRIFERFYRADKARSRERGGTGLGLSIVKHIVLAHGGTVRAESEQGHGTSIIIRLPVDAPANLAATLPAA